MDNTGKMLITVCIGLGIVIGIEATRFYYTTIKPNIETFTKKAST